MTEPMFCGKCGKPVQWNAEEWRFACKCGWELTFAQWKERLAYERDKEK